MQKLVISGATSMIGSSVVKCALERNLEALCIVRKDSANLTNLPKSEQIKIHYADLPEYSHLDISGNYDVFYHFAWDKTFIHSRDNVDSQLANIRYTLDAVRLAKRLGCKKFIGAGSQAEYGIANEPLKPYTPANPQSGYGIAKHAAGKMCGLLSSQLGMQFNWTRILSIYGKHDNPDSLIMYIIKELKENRTPELTKCEQIWDYLHCDDAARALLAVGKDGVNNKTYPLGSGSYKKLYDYINIVKNIVNPNAGLKFGHKEYYPHQPMFLAADISELSADTGWKPRISFEDGIRDLI